MNKLQKKAWTELQAAAFCVAGGGVGLAVLVRSNASGAVYLMICLIVGLPILFYGYLQHLAEHKRLDEREKQIAQKAFAMGTYAFVAFFGCSAFILFFMVGGAGHVPAYALPTVFLGGIFVGQFTESAAILIQFAREQADE